MRVTWEGFERTLPAEESPLLVLVTLVGVDLTLPVDERTFPTDENPWGGRAVVTCSLVETSVCLAGTSCFLFSSKEAMLAEDVAKMKMFLMNSVSPSDMLLFCSTNCSAVCSRRDRSCVKVNVGVVVGREADILRIGAW